jgi:hypothetical protein
MGLVEVPKKLDTPFKDTILWGRIHDRYYKIFSKNRILQRDKLL